ncbi:C2 calcium-dependent membrane targeting and RhoGAP domain containing protein [Aphelenchoides besseyi]|nr:C2 calcium-dependent membrane targeting and RhoGAP domain containing protein [Aphelenchoides besseyi]
MPWPPDDSGGSSTQPSNEASGRNQQVEQQSSTLTTQGGSGFSARVLNRAQYPTPDGRDVLIVQLVEITKKPGQSLGLYLREGNGVDKSTGVFASRFGEGSELERLGNIIRPGDEILNVNNVEVATMSIDDVVYALSIPRRLLLRTRFLKNRRDAPEFSGVQAGKVMIYQKENSEIDKKESTTGTSANQNSKPSQGLLSKPLTTASTWLGKRVRLQQQQQMSSIDRSEHQQNSLESPRSVPVDTFISQSAYIAPSPKLWPPQEYVAPGTSIGGRPIFSSATLGRPSPLRQQSLSNYDVPPFHRRAPLMSQTSLMADGRIPHVNTNTYVPPIQPPNPYHTQNSAYKSNSLPRRRIQVSGPTTRSVKWRDSVGAEETEEAVYSDRAAMSDIAAVTSPRTPRRYDFSMRAHSTVSSPGVVHRPLIGGRSITDIFSSQEYRNWATVDPRAPDYRIRPAVGAAAHQIGHSMRSSSLPSRTIGRVLPSGTINFDSSIAPSPQYAPDSTVGMQTQNLLDRLHLSPLVNRRVPLRAAGPGIDIDNTPVLSALTGLLSIWIVEGRNLRVPDKTHSNQLYCVIEIDELHRARTGISTPEQRFRWREGFEIDVQNAQNAQFFVYAWNPQLRHRFCHKANIKLVDAFFVDELNGVRVFALNLEPRGQLMVRLAFADMPRAYRRAVSVRYHASFATPLQQIAQREQKETPVAFTRLINEVERRGIDAPGLYYLCGAVERKNYIKEQLNRDPFGTDIGNVPVPDVNLLTCLVKDFLRELPEPLVPCDIYTMLIDAAKTILPTDKEGNQDIIQQIVDCLPAINRNTLILLIDHIRLLVGSEPHNGLTLSRVTAIFGPLIFCVYEGPQQSQTVRKVDLLDVHQAAAALRLLLDYWPGRNKIVGQFR